MDRVMRLQKTRLLLTIALVGLLAACGQQPNETKTTKPALIETKEILPGTMFATFDPTAGYEAMQAAAKEACGTEAICKVVIFGPGTVLPTQFPMTDREVSQEIGNYTLNRNTGADELLANCKIVKGAPTIFCAASE